MSKTLILVKHSLPEIIKDLPACEWRLSEEGRLRAHRLAERLRSHPFDVLVSSVEPKALETAQIITAKCGVNLHVIEGLQEHERSKVPYLSSAQFESVVREFFENPDVLVFGSETANEAHERFSNAVHSVLAQQEGGTSVIVSHGTVISLYVSHLTGEPDFALWNKLGLPGFIVLDLQSNALITIENIL
jgi:broad specificity phosphatase PhoE